jgi:glycosyltransferase involved in cell wall biosynthesis
LNTKGTKIGLVIGQLSAGGAEGQLALLARALRGSRYRPIVYCVSGQSRPIGDELAAEGIELRCFPGSPASRVPRLARAFSADGVALVHAWLFIANTYAWLANRGTRPLITSARNCKRQGWLHDTVNRVAFRSSRRVVANSRQVRDYIETHYGAPAGRIRVVYNGIDVERFRPAEGGGGGPPLVVGVGRLVPQKDPELFVRLAAAVAAERPHTRFAFVGEGPLRPRVEQMIARFGLQDRFSLPGETRDVAGVLQQASLFWLTSAWEGLPNVVLEAMACGVPVVAADVGGTRELVRPEVDGYLVAPGDAGAFVRHTLGLLAEPDRRLAYARSARARALQFATTKMVEAMVRLYDEVL